MELYLATQILNFGLPSELLGHPQVCLPIVANRAHVNLRRQAKIEDLRDHIGCLKIEDHVWECSGQNLAQFAHILDRRRVTLLQSHLDDTVI